MYDFVFAKVALQSGPLLAYFHLFIATTFISYDVTVLCPAFKVCNNFQSMLIMNETLNIKNPSL